jgi:hypothetical protein
VVGTSEEQSLKIRLDHEAEGLPECRQKLGCPAAVVRIAVVVQAPRIVKEGE